ncbi:MAG: hypothetical protein GY749_27080 [Desulfobacteraceae bacterium]|nr:hypothetical protein [Desulfobacteraceae bacterium]
MINKPTIIGIYFGLTFGLIYLIIHAIKKTKPNYNQFAVVVLSCVGAIVGLDFGYIALTESSDNLCKLSEQRLPMVLGAGAVVWISIEQIILVYYQVIVRQ